MKKSGRCHTSNSKDWCTPPKIVDAVRMFLGGISFDPCSNKYSIVNAATECLLPETDGLSVEWDYPTIFVNPPYGRDRNRNTSILDWIKKCSESREKYNSKIIALIPVATNTEHWKNYIFQKADAICFLKDTRLKFLDKGSESNKGAPMACALIYWGPYAPHFRDWFSKDFGYVVLLDN